MARGHDALTGRGYAVSIVQNPLTSFADDVAADVDAAGAAFLRDAQVPIAMSAPVTVAVCKTKPSWYVMASEDGAIAPALPRGGDARRGLAGRGASVETQAIAAGRDLSDTGVSAAARWLRQVLPGEAGGGWPRSAV